jgi:hypothetical protein
MKLERTRLDIIAEFYQAPPETLFSQQTLCAVLGCSAALAERNRWAGKGVPFIKIGHTVRYYKRDIVIFIEQQKIRHSTTQPYASN